MWGRGWLRGGQCTQLFEVVEVLHEGQGADQVLEHVVVERQDADVPEFLEGPLEAEDPVGVQVQRLDLHVVLEPVDA